MIFTESEIMWGGYGMPTSRDVPGSGANGDRKRPEVGPSRTLRRDKSRVTVTLAGSAMCWDGHHWTPPSRGSPHTYRLMDLQPTLARARGHYYGRLVSSGWEFKKRTEAISEKWLDEAKETFTPMRREIIGECLRALTFGNRAFEKVWAVQEGQFTLGSMDAYEPDGLTIWKYADNERFAGIGYGQPDQRIDETRSWVFTLDGWGGDLVGTSYHEAAYDPWCDWNYSRWNRIGIGRKLAGILPVLKYPPGETEVNGETRNNAEVAREILASLGLGRGVAMPSLAVDQQEAANNPELANTSLWQLEFMDAGSYSSATAGVIGAQEYDDKQLCRAWRLGERTLVEATTSGSRADSETSSEGDLLQLEYIDDEIAGQFSEGVIDQWARLKFGAKPGDIFVEPLPLSDPALSFKREVAKLILSSPTSAPLAQANIEIRPLLEGLGIQLLPETAVPVVAPLEPPEPGEDEHESEDDELALSADGLALNCGTGAGGFKAGNDCAAGGGGSGKSTAMKYRPPKPSHLSLETIDLWHGTSLDAWDRIKEDNQLIGGDRGNNASARTESAAQYPEDTGADVLILVRAESKSLDIDPNDQIGETVSDGLFKSTIGSSATLGKHEIVAAFDVSDVKKGKYETAIRWMQKGQFDKAQKLGVKLLYGNP